MNTRGHANQRPSIHLDNGAGARMVTEHLIGLGRRNLVHISGPEDNVDAAERAAAFRETSEEHGVAFEIIPGDFNEPTGAAAVEQLLKAGSRFDGIFAANDMMASGALQALRRAGRNVPQDVAVAGFDDVPLASLLGLTTVRVRIADLGERALDRLITLIEGGEDNHAEELHKPELVVRSTTDPEAPDR
jgi:LacI family transcriptional regulator